MATCALCGSTDTVTARSRMTRRFFCVDMAGCDQRRRTPLRLTHRLNAEGRFTYPWQDEADRERETDRQTAHETRTGWATR